MIYDLSTTIAQVHCRFDILTWLTEGVLPGEPLLLRWLSDRHSLTDEEYSDLAHLLKIECRKAYEARKANQPSPTQANLASVH